VCDGVRGCAGVWVRGCVGAWAHDHLCACVFSTTRPVRCCKPVRVLGWVVRHLKELPILEHQATVRAAQLAAAEASGRLDSRTAGGGGSGSAAAGAGSGGAAGAVGTCTHPCTVVHGGVLVGGARRMGGVRGQLGMHRKAWMRACEWGTTQACVCARVCE
jgi:hypothetical protein